MFAPPINRLITELARFPGIGQRTAQRLAFHILRASDEEALALADAIREVKETVGQCEVCFNLATEATCRICQDERRDAHVICVVEEPSDVIPIERTNEFSGATTCSAARCRRSTASTPRTCTSPSCSSARRSNGVREVVVATNATTTGEATALYLADALRERAPARCPSPAWPAACRWAPTWSTPTRSRWAARCAAGASSSAAGVRSSRGSARRDPGDVATRASLPERGPAAAQSACVGEIDAVDVQAKPGARAAVRHRPAAAGRADRPAARRRRCPSSPSAPTPRWPACARPPAAFVLRLNRFFWSDGEAGFRRYLALAERFTSRGYLVELQVRYHPGAGQEGDIGAWTRHVREVVRRFGANPRVVALQIANEVNLTSRPTRPTAPTRARARRWCRA